MCAYLKSSHLHISSFLARLLLLSNSPSQRRSAPRCFYRSRNYEEHVLPFAYRYTHIVYTSSELNIFMYHHIRQYHSAMSSRNCFSRAIRDFVQNIWGMMCLCINMTRMTYVTNYKRKHNVEWMQKLVPDSNKCH